MIDLRAKSAKVVAGYNNIDIRRFQWVNDNRLVFDVTDKRIAIGGEFKGAGLYAVDRDGDPISQTDSRISRRILPWHTFMLDQPGAQNSDAIYVESYEWEEKGNEVRTVKLLKLDTVNGTVQTIQRPAKVEGWILDHKGEPRLAYASAKGVSTVHYLDPATSRWRVLASFPTYKGSANSFTPVGFGSDGRLFATAYGSGDTTSLYLIDLATGKRSKQPVVETPGYDFEGELISNGEELLGVRIETDAAGTVWFDPALQAAQEKLDKALPGTVNLMSFSHGVNQEWTLVKTYSDVRPGAYYLFN
ncbi:MAG: family peptidase [Massilia sp.]|nr:family peptidase [Massilia sp.]